MAMLRSSVGLAIRHSAFTSAISSFNGTADLTLRRLPPAAAASRFSVGGCGSPRSIHTEQEVEKSIEKSKQRLLNLYMKAQTDNNRLDIKGVEEELDYLIHHLQDKATRCLKEKSSFATEAEENFHILDTIVAPTMGWFMIFCVVWVVGFD